MNPARSWVRYLLAFTLTTTPLIAQSIFTYAGGGPIGDGGPATQAILNSPMDIVVDGAGNLYINDWRHKTIRKVSAASGIITTVAGGGTSGEVLGGPATLTELRDPWKIAVDPAGNLFINDWGTRIYRVDGATGIVTLFASTSYSIIGFAADSGGNLYVADRWNHLVRRIDALTGAITIVAGGGTPADGYGDGGPATAARLYEPEDVAIAPIGYGDYLYIAERGTTSPAVDGRIRRVDLSTGTITTWGGGGASKPATGLDVRDVSFSRTVWPYNTLQDIAVGGDGGVYLVSGGSRYSLWKIVSSQLIFPPTRIMNEIPDPGYYGLAVDAASNLYTVNKNNHVAWKLQSPSWSQSIVAGSSNIGDGRIATAAELSDPTSVVVDSSGRLLVSESAGNRIRRIDPATHVIETLATSSTIINPGRMTIDASDNLYVAAYPAIVKVRATDGQVTTFAGSGGYGFSGDGGPAVNATFYGVMGLARDTAGNTYIVDASNHRIRRIDAVTGIINTVAGKGPDASPYGGSFCGDGGLATDACLNRPWDVAVNAGGDLFIADFQNARVRKVTASTGIITTVVGTGTQASKPVETGQIATSTNIGRPLAVHVDAAGNLIISDEYSIFRVNSSSGVITQLAGVGSSGFTGDGGPATSAKTSIFGVTSILETGGRTFLTDQGNARLRVVPKCVTPKYSLTRTPSNGTTGVSLPVTLVWSESSYTYSYDVLLDTNPTPTTVVAADLASKAFLLRPWSGSISFTPSNLQPGTTYYWRIVSKGDRFCSSLTPASSPIYSFTTAGACGPPGSFQQLSPINGASVGTSSVTATWLAAAGAASYDVYAGATNPPPFYATTTETSQSIASLVPNSTYYWFIVARTACDASLTRATAVRSFVVAGSCSAPGSVSTSSPSNGQAGVATSTTLQWTAATNATSYDLFLGTASPPPLFQGGITSTSKSVAGLVAGTLYRWQVKARVACNTSYVSSSAIASFTTAGTCGVPSTPPIVFSPPGAVSVGQSYVIAWSAVTGLDAAGQYVVERSTSSTFATILDTQRTRNTSATFIAATAVPHYHRIRAVPYCNAANASANSATITVAVSSAAPNVIFTIQPKAVLTHPGQNIEDLTTTFTIENISGTAVSVDIPRLEIGGSIPFFSIRDPFGGDVFGVTLQPRTPKTFDIHFAGPSKDIPGSYQGIVYVVSRGTSLPVVPYAFVNLKVGDEAGALPAFHVGGVASDYAAFPPFEGFDDSARAPIEVQIHNPGSSSLSLGGEVGPEVWLEPETGWNTNPIPAGAYRVVRLYTNRIQAPNGANFTRATYFTVRTSDGRSARLLVQDNDSDAVGTGRLNALDPRARSFVIPDVRSNAAAMSALTLTNVGSDVLPVQVIYTPADSDGFSNVARRTTVIVPPDDIVAITDPLTNLFGLTRPAAGQIELRVDEAKLGLLLASASLVETGGVDAQIGSIPVLARGAGARSGAPHQLLGVTHNAALTSDLVLAETTGIDGAEVSIGVFDASGKLLRESRKTLLRYGQTRIANVVTALGAGSSLERGRIHISVVSGAGTVAGVLETTNGTNFGAIASEPLATASGAAKAAMRESRGLPAPIDGSVATAVAIPFAATGTVDNSSSSTYRTILGLAAPWGAAASFSVTFASAEGSTSVHTESLASGATKEYADVLRDLFGIVGSARGSLRVEATPSGSVYSRLVDGVETVTAIPVVETSSEQMASLTTSNTPLHLDGLEQSTDPSRGRRWNVYVTEAGGGSGSVTVRLYEAANRDFPLAQKEFSVTPNGQLQLENVFRALELDTALRSKDRTGVLCVVSPAGGNAIVTASAVAIENESGAAMSYLFTPGNGLPFSTVQPMPDGPSITSFVPASGLPGTTVTINGSRLDNVVGVSFAGTAATSYSIVNTSQITTTVPAGASTGRITLTSLSWPGTSGSDFTVLHAPTITGFNPASGSVGTSVTISGTYLANATAVSFAGTSATFTANSETQISAVVPAAASTGTISVTTPGGTATSASNFTVTVSIPAPVISSFTPTSGGVGAAVQVSGLHLAGATSLRFNNVQAQITSNTDTLLSGIVPEGASTGPITVVTPGGSVASATPFVVIPRPAITSFAPSSGPIGTAVGISGNYLTGATSVKFNGTTAVFNIDSDVHITATVPVGATSGTVSVTTAGGTAISVAVFTVIPPPMISSFSPTSGTPGTAVTISGSGLLGASSVKFNGIASIYFVNGDTQISAAVPAGASTGVITVTAPGGTATSSTLFIVVTPPHVASFSPASGVVGAVVTIDGNGFTGTTSVRFGGASAVFGVVSDERISATVPDSAVTGLICVTTPVGSACSEGSFTITTSAQRGDLNGDGEINAADVLFLINALFGGGTPPANGDVNGDLKVDIADVFYLINFVFTGGTAPSP